MKRHIGILVACWLWALVASHLAYGQNVIQAEGAAAIHKDFVDIARDRAIADAQRRAIEQAVGVMITNETLVENYQIVSDKIFSQSKGYIQSYEVVLEERQGDLYKVSIEATVSVGQLEKDLDAIRLIIARKAKPRLMILFGGNAKNDLIAEARMAKLFLSKGFKVVDSEAVRKNLHSEDLRTLTGDPKAAAQAGRRFGAEVVILCAVETGSSPFKIGDVEMYSNSATVSAKVVNVDTSNIITTGSKTKRLPGIKGYIQPSTEQASEMLASVLMDDILAQWSSELTNVLEVKLSALGFRSYNELNSFKHLLNREVRGIQEVRQRLYSQGKAEFEIELRGDTTALADDLSRLRLDGRKIEVLEITQNRVEIRLLP